MKQQKGFTKLIKEKIDEVKRFKHSTTKSSSNCK